MKWQIIEIHTEGAIHRANYRVVGETLEMTTGFGEFKRPKGPFRAEIAARELLRKLIKRSAQAA